jgi:hypothetical protein
VVPVKQFWTVFHDELYLAPKISRLLPGSREGLHFWTDRSMTENYTYSEHTPYILRATGWVRFFAGLQSLLSVYLLALWVLTYFGRPFE